MSNEPQTVPSVDLTIKTEEERDLIIATFKDNDFLLKALRSLFLGLAVSAEQKSAILDLKREVKEIIKKRFCPKIEDDTAIGIVNDVWMGVDEEVLNKNPTSILQAIASHDEAQKMANMALLLLDNIDGEKPDIQYKPNFVLNGSQQELADPLGIGLLARNKFIRLVNNQTWVLKTIAQQEKKTPQELAEIEKKNSSR